jgi:hypothetical protein
LVIREQGKEKCDGIEVNEEDAQGGIDAKTTESR